MRQALTQVFQAPVSTTPGTTGATGALSPQVRSLLNDAQAQYQQSQTDLKAGNLGAYQTDINNLEKDLQQVQQLTGWHGDVDDHDHHDDHFADWKLATPQEAPSGRAAPSPWLGGRAPSADAERARTDESTPIGEVIVCRPRRGVEQSGSSSGS